MFKKLNLAIILLVSATSLFAQSPMQFYTGGALGGALSSYSVDYSEGVSVSSHNNTAWALFFGVVLSPNFGVEADYTSYGRGALITAPQYSGDVTASLSSFGVFLRAVAFSTSYFDIYTKLGISNLNVALKTNSSNFSGSSTGFAFALGTDINVTNTTSIFAQYQNEQGVMQIDSANIGASVNMWSIGVKYIF